MHIMRYTLRTGAAALFSLTLLLVAFVGTASAHAKVTQSDPAINSTIAKAPTTITVTALENMNPDPKKSNLFVYGPDGDLISQGDAKVSVSDPKKMSVNVKADDAKADGTYVVRWITASAEDGDPDEGAFVFSVKAGGATTPAKSTPAPAATSTTSSSNNVVLPVVIAAIVALLVGLGGGFALGRNRPAVATQNAAAPEEVPTESTKR